MEEKGVCVCVCVCCVLCVVGACLYVFLCACFGILVNWPSGLRRQFKALVRKGVGSNPTLAIFIFIFIFIFVFIFVFIGSVRVRVRVLLYNLIVRSLRPLRAPLVFDKLTHTAEPSRLASPS